MAHGDRLAGQCHPHKAEAGVECSVNTNIRDSLISDTHLHTELPD